MGYSDYFNKVLKLSNIFLQYPLRGTSLPALSWRHSVNIFDFFTSWNSGSKCVQTGWFSSASFPNHDDINAWYFRCKRVCQRLKFVCIVVNNLKKIYITSLFNADVQSNWKSPFIHLSGRDILSIEVHLHMTTFTSCEQSGKGFVGLEK